uniref:Immunoglobulin V-set domain-containing protein n=1 Tax=Amphiprion percula TaxID=161767 RepID=A0A3P8SNZ8_AMPPE
MRGGTCVNCQQLTAVKDEESSLEGSTVTLTYTYSQQATGSDWFYWYRQHAGKPPEFLILNYGTNNATSGGLSAAVSDDKNQISMKISSAAVSDSAVYYCAETAKLCTKTFGTKTTENSTTSTRGRHTLLHFYGLFRSKLS